MHFSALAMTTAAVLAFGGVPLHAQTWQMPPDSQRCPSKWGAGDQRGSGNMMKPKTVLRAAKLIRTGEVFELVAVLSPDPREAFINAGRVFLVSGVDPGRSVVRALPAARVHVIAHGGGRWLYANVADGRP